MKPLLLTYAFLFFFFWSTDKNCIKNKVQLKGYKQNRMKTKQHYDQRKRDMMEKAIQEGTPEGQQQLMQADEPVEAVKFKAGQSLKDKVN